MLHNYVHVKTKHIQTYYSSHLIKVPSLVHSQNQKNNSFIVLMYYTKYTKNSKIQIHYVFAHFQRVLPTKKKKILH
jgi:hypothetical protein